MSVLVRSGLRSRTAQGPVTLATEKNARVFFLFSCMARPVFCLCCTGAGTDSCTCADEILPCPPSSSPVSVGIRSSLPRGIEFKSFVHSVDELPFVMIEVALQSGKKSGIALPNLRGTRRSLDGDLCFHEKTSFQNSARFMRDGHAVMEKVQCPSGLLVERLSALQFRGEKSVCRISAGGLNEKTCFQYLKTGFLNSKYWCRR